MHSNSQTIINSLYSKTNPHIGIINLSAGFNYDINLLLTDFLMPTMLFFTSFVSELIGLMDICFHLQYILNLFHFTIKFLNMF